MVRLINENRGQRKKTFTLSGDNLRELEVFISFFLENSELAMFDFTNTPLFEADRMKIIIAPIGKVPLNVHYSEIRRLIKEFNN